MFYNATHIKLFIDTSKGKAADRSYMSSEIRIITVITKIIKRVIDKTPHNRLVLFFNCYDLYAIIRFKTEPSPSFKTHINE